MKSLVGLVFLSLLLVPAPLAYADVGAFVIQTIDIRSQPLSKALDDFAVQTNSVVIAKSSLLQNKSTNSLQAEGKVDDLLNLLLKGTDLTFLKTNQNVYVIKERRETIGSLPVKKKNDPLDTLSYYQDKVTVTVTGSYIDSLSSASLRKNAASSIIEVVDAKGVADFSAQNVAEALQRVPGISVSYGRGEALFVNVRGLGPTFQIVTLNGYSLAVNENVRDSGQDGRQYRFDMVPTELVAGLDVIKTPDASHVEGAIGGIVNIRTFKPLELETGRFVASVAGSYPELVDELDHTVSILGSWQNAGGSMGVLGAMSYNERTLRQDRIKLVRWDALNATKLNCKSCGDLSDQILAPTDLRPTLERENRERFGLNAIFQYQPNDRVFFEADAFFLSLASDYDERTYSAGWDFEAAELESPVIVDGVLLSGIIQGGSQIGVETSQLKHENLFLSARANYAHQGDELNIYGFYTRAISGTDNPITRTRVSSDDVGRISFQFPNGVGAGLPNIEFLDADLTSASLLPFRRIEYRDQQSLDAEMTLGADYKHYSDFAFISEISAGLEYRDRKRDYDRRDIILNQNAGAYFSEEFYSLLPLSNLFADETATFPRQWLNPIPEAFAQIEGLKYGFSTKTPADLRNSYGIGEEIYSIYSKMAFDTVFNSVPLRGNFGVRASQTFQTSQGHGVDANDVAIPLLYQNQYLDVLPSANIVFQFSDKVQLRAAFAKVITRPSLADLAPRITLSSSGAREAIGGNPYLKRFKSWQSDIGLTYQRSPELSVNLNGFLKEFDQFVYDQIRPTEINEETYFLTAPFNGGDARVYGVELAYHQKFANLPSPLNGLGLQANLTLSESEASYSDTLKDDLEGIAKKSYSLGGFYEWERFLARMVYNYRGEVLSAVGTNDALSINDEGFGSLDGAASYRLSDNLIVSFEAKNILDSGQERFVSDHQFGGFTTFGRTLQFSIRYSSGDRKDSIKRYW